MSHALYLQITDALVDNGYIIIENALDNNLSKNLLKFAKNSNHFKPAGVSSRKQIDKDIRRDKILWLEEDNGTQSEFLDFCSGLREFLNKELFLGLTYFESHFALYEKDDFYETHVDAFKNSKNRVVTVVYYLNPKWKEVDKGEMILYNEEFEQLTKVAPHANTLAIFLSEKFPHEVLATNNKRYSIAGWFRVDIREEIPKLQPSLRALYGV